MEKFVEDVGLPPTLLHTVDRIDVNGDYKKTNVRWATRLQQANNQRMNGNRNQFNLIGVTQTHGKYFEARVKINGKLKYLGSFRTPLLAHRAYMRKKLEVIKSIDNGTI